MSVVVYPNFNSAEIKNHFLNPKSVAIAFLFAIGAKALVITEQKFSKADVFIGVNKEAEIRQELIYDERVRSIKKRLLQHSSTKVYKYSRKGRLKIVDITIRYEKSKGGYISWNSKFNTVKTFKLDSSSTISALNDKPLDSFLKGNHNGIDIKKFSENNSILLPFLRLKNKSRNLDIRFQNLYEMEAFIQIIQIFQPNLTASIIHSKANL